VLKSFINKFFGINKEVESNKDSNRIEGISLFNKKRFEEAHKIFKKLNEENSTSENKYFLSLTSLKRRDFEKAIALFEEAINTFELDIKNVQHSIPNMKTYFANQLIEKENYPLAFKLLKDVSNTYCEYKILDDTFLYMRGIPFFGDYVEILNKVKGKVEKIEYEKLVSKLEIELDKDGKFYIDEIIKKNKNGN